MLTKVRRLTKPPAPRRRDAIADFASYGVDIESLINCVKMPPPFEDDEENEGQLSSQAELQAKNAGEGSSQEGKEVTVPAATAAKQAPHRCEQGVPK